MRVSYLAYLALRNKERRERLSEERLREGAPMTRGSRVRAAAPRSASSWR